LAHIGLHHTNNDNVFAVNDDDEDDENEGDRGAKED
jgi:hypothetical protein